VQLLAPPKAEPWQVVGPFKTENTQQGFTNVFEPEKEVDLKKAYAGVAVRSSENASYELRVRPVARKWQLFRDPKGRWQVAGSVRPPLSVLYSDVVSGRPSTLRLQASGSPAADVTVRLSDMNINVPLEPEVFAVDVPAGAQPLTIDELRRAGPLGGA